MFELKIFSKSHPPGDGWVLLEFRLGIYVARGNIGRLEKRYWKKEKRKYRNLIIYGNEIKIAIDRVERNIYSCFEV